MRLMLSIGIFTSVIILSLLLCQGFIKGFTKLLINQILFPDANCITSKRYKSSRSIYWFLKATDVTATV